MGLAASTEMPQNGFVSEPRELDVALTPTTVGLQKGLQDAFASGILDYVKIFVEGYGANVEATQGFDYTYRMFAAMIGYLLDRGCDIQDFDTFGHTALM